MSHPRRFFVENISEGEQTSLSLEQSKHVSKVLRLDIEDKLVIVCKKTSKTFQAKILELKPFVKVEASLEIKEDSISKSTKCICFAACKGKTNELVIEKASEQGVPKIIIWSSDHSVINIKKEAISKKLERWNKVAERAAAQARLNFIPNVCYIKNTNDLLSELAKDTKVKTILASLSNRTKSLKELKSQNTPFNIIIGPEGDFSEDEYEIFRRADILEITLGHRVLRAETAAICSIAMLETLYQIKN